MGSWVLLSSVQRLWGRVWCFVPSAMAAVGWQLSRACQGGTPWTACYVSVLFVVKAPLTSVFLVSNWRKQWTTCRQNSPWRRESIRLPWKTWRWSQMRFMRGDDPLPWGPGDAVWVLKGATPLWKTCLPANQSWTLSQVSAELSFAWEYPVGCGLERKYWDEDNPCIVQLEVQWLLWDWLACYVSGDCRSLLYPSIYPQGEGIWVKMHQLLPPVLCIVLYGGGGRVKSVAMWGACTEALFSLWSLIKHHQPGVLCPQTWCCCGMEAQMAINKL